MFVFTEFTVEAETHVKVRATFVDMSIGTVLTFLTTLLHKIRAYFEIMTEIALVPVSTAAHRLELVAGLDLALVVRIGTVVGQLTFPVDEFFTDSVGG